MTGLVVTGLIAAAAISAAYDLKLVHRFHYWLTGQDLKKR